jgi:sugar (pentulose or hexulose) kinase
VRLPRAAIGAPLGDAIVAAAGVGVYPSIEVAVAQMVEQGPEYQPKRDMAFTYDALYEVYVNLYPALKSSFEALAHVPIPGSETHG